jgi:two-component system sensor histidine kinase ResE
VEKDLLTAPNGVAEFLQRLERSATLRAETVARMRLEQQLEAERDRLRQTLFGLAEFVIATDRYLRVRLINPQAREMLGLPEESRPEVPLDSLPLPAEVTAAIKKVGESGEMEEGEVEWEGRSYHMRVYPIFLQNREVEGMICVLRDITEQRKLEQLRTHFFSMATHDLKSPLSVIVAYADYLKEGMAGELTPEQKRMVETILDAAKKMAEMVVKFLEHFNISEGLLTFNWESVDLVTMLGEITKNMSMVAKSRGLELTWEHDVAHARVWGDVQYLERAFSNILENALKYTPEGGKVSVSLTSDGEGYRVDISDTGPGIPKSLIPVIFRPYRRGMGELTKGKNGIGLGLYTAHEVISKANGRIEVESKIGKGTTFHVWLPALERGKAMVGGEG